MRRWLKPLFSLEKILCFKLISLKKHFCTSSSISISNDKIIAPVSNVPISFWYNMDELQKRLMALSFHYKNKRFPHSLKQYRLVISQCISISIIQFNTGILFLFFLWFYCSFPALQSNLSVNVKVHLHLTSSN